MHLHFIVRPFDLKIRRKVKWAWFLWTVEFYGEGDERNGQISVKSRNLENLRGNINVDTFISDHVVFFLEFFHRRKREREKGGGRWNVSPRPQEELVQCKERTKQKEGNWSDCRLKLAFFVTRYLIDSSWLLFALSFPRLTFFHYVSFEKINPRLNNYRRVADDWRFNCPRFDTVYTNFSNAKKGWSKRRKLWSDWN